MKKKSIYLVLIFLTLGFAFFPVHSKEHSKEKAAVTYELSGGRLGDNLIAYMHAKYISYKYGIPLLYKPFKYSDCFLLDQKEERYSKKKAKKFDRKVVLGKGDSVDLNSKKSTLYVVPYFPESECERKYYKAADEKSFPYFAVDWKDPGFRSLLLNMLSPTHSLQLNDCTEDRVHVAVHVRKGGGADPANVHLLHPLKFLPDSFYLEQIEQVCLRYPTENIQFHIFTDDLNPSAIAAQYRSYFSDPRIEFTYRKEGNYHDRNVVEDLFSMMQFDCLIRPESSYSIVASLLKEYDLLMHPDELRFENNVAYIDRVKIVDKKEMR